MYFCKLESVLEFACKSWSICLSPLHLAHEIDVQNYLVLGHFRDYVPIPSHLLLCPPSFFGYKGSSIWPIVASLHICCAVYEVRYRCVCWWVIDTATLKMNRVEKWSQTVNSLVCHLSHCPCGLAASPRKPLDTLMISRVEAARPLCGPASPDSHRADEKKTILQRKTVLHNVHDCVTKPLWSSGEWSTLPIISWMGIDLAGFPLRSGGFWRQFRGLPAQPGLWFSEQPVSLETNSPTDLEGYRVCLFWTFALYGRDLCEFA